MAIFNLTELQHSTNRKGPFAMYIYGDDGLHSGAAWFRDKPIYPDEEITTGQAHNRAFVANAKKQEVRICDPGDMLVFHAVNGEVIYGENFWHEVGEARKATPAIQPQETKAAGQGPDEMRPTEQGT